MPYITYLGPGNWWQVEVHGYVFQGRYQEVFFWKKHFDQIDLEFVRDFAENR